MNKHREDIKREIVNIASDIFSISKEDIDEGMHAGGLEEWDSLGHIKLFFAIEKQFNVNFSTGEIIAANSIKKIIDKVMELKKE